MSDAATASPAKKKVAAKKPAKKTPAAHPKYIDMISAALASLKERNGSSRIAIMKYINANFKVGDNANSHVKLALKRGVAGGSIKQVKGTGASGSFKLVAKVEPKKKKPVAKKPAAKTATKKKPAAKKTPKKKAAAKTKTPKKAAAKKPVAKKPAAKKAAKKPAKKVAKKTPKKKTATKKGGKK